MFYFIYHNRIHVLVEISPFICIGFIHGNTYLPGFRISELTLWYSLPEWFWSPVSFQPSLIIAVAELVWSTIGISNFSCKAPDSKYFSLHKSHDLSHICSVVAGKQSQAIALPRFVPMKVCLQKQVAGQVWIISHGVPTPHLKQWQF